MDLKDKYKTEVLEQMHLKLCFALFHWYFIKKIPSLTLLCSLLRIILVILDFSPWLLDNVLLSVTPFNFNCCLCFSIQLISPSWVYFCRFLSLFLRIWGCEIFSILSVISSNICCAWSRITTFNNYPLTLVSKIVKHHISTPN